MTLEHKPEARLLEEAGLLSPTSDLPQIPGGWTSREVVVGSRTFHLTLPADPNEFLGDEQTLTSGPTDDDYVPYWPHLWPASLQMAAIIQQADMATGTPTLELGCGVGLVGLAAQAAGLDVTFSDYEPAALQLVQHNAHSNDLGHARTQLLDWKHPPSQRFPFIIACEVLYESRHHLPLVNLLETMLEPDGECWIGDAGRQVAAPFAERARNFNFTVELCDEECNIIAEPHVGRFQMMKLRKAAGPVSRK